MVHVIYAWCLLQMPVGILHSAYAEKFTAEAQRRRDTCSLRVVHEPVGEFSL
jgi:hypothetical protein